MEKKKIDPAVARHKEEVETRAAETDKANQTLEKLSEAHLDEVKKMKASTKDHDDLVKSRLAETEAANKKLEEPPAKEEEL